MSQVQQTALVQWADGQTVTAAQLTQNQEVLRVAHNDTDTQVTNMKAAGITNTMLAANSVATSNIQAGAVTNTQLASSSVATANIQNGAVTQAQLANGSVGSAQIINGAVGTAQLANASVTSSQIDGTTVWSASQVQAAVNNASKTATVAMGTAFPAGPYNEGQEFWRSDLKELFVYSVSAADWVATSPVATTTQAGLVKGSASVPVAGDGTLSATPASIGAVATSQLGAASGVPTLDTNSRVVQTANNALNVQIGGTNYPGSQSATANTVAVRDPNGNVASQYPFSVMQNPNLLFNPSARLGLSGWSVTSGSAWAAAFGQNYGEGGLFQSPNISTSGTYQTLRSQQMPVTSGVGLTLSAELNSTSLTAGFAYVNIEAFNASNTSLGSVIVQANPGQNWAKQSTQYTTPANTTYVTVTLGLNNAAVGQAYFRKIKVEAGTYATTFSDDNTLNTQQYGSVIPFVQKHVQARIDLNRGGTSGSATSNTPMTTGSLPFVFHASEWTQNTFYAEFAAYVANSAYTAYVGIWDLTSGTAVAGSEVSTTATSVTTSLRSGSFSLTDGHVYVPYYRFSSGGNGTIYSADLLQLI